MGLPYGVSPNILYVHTYFPCTYQNIFIYIQIFSVHNTDTFCKYSNTDKLRSFVSVSSVYTLNTIGIRRRILLSKTSFKPMGLSYSVSHNPPMYINSPVHKNSFVY